jgi:hypothetical protein
MRMHGYRSRGRSRSRKHTHTRRAHTVEQWECLSLLRAQTDCGRCSRMRMRMHKQAKQTNVRPRHAQTRLRMHASAAFKQSSGRSTITDRSDHTTALAGEKAKSAIAIQRGAEAELQGQREGFVVPAGFAQRHHAQRCTGEKQGVLHGRAL